MGIRTIDMLRLKITGKRSTLNAEPAFARLRRGKRSMPNAVIPSGARNLPLAVAITLGSLRDGVASR